VSENHEKEQKHYIYCIRVTKLESLRKTNKTPNTRRKEEEKQMPKTNHKTNKKQAGKKRRKEKGKERRKRKTREEEKGKATERKEERKKK